MVTLCDLPFAVPVTVTGNDPVAAAGEAIRERVALPGPVGVIWAVTPAGVPETVSVGVPAVAPLVVVLIVAEDEPP